MTKITDLRKPQPTKVLFASLKVGQAYEDGAGNFCIKTSASFDGGNNCMYCNAFSDEWESEVECANEKVIPLNIEINILP
jgi:hypothetical protein